MNPTVAVVAQGAMGAGVGGRLVERGLARGHLAGRPQRGQRQARQGRRHDRGVRPGAGARRLFPVDPAAERCAGAGRKDGGADRPEQPQADLCRLQRGEPADQDRDRPRHHQGRLAVRRCRHHRRPAEGGLRRSGHLCVRSRRRAVCAARRFWPRGARDGRADRRGLGAEDVLRRHHQGADRARRHDDAGRDARRRRRQRCAPSSSAASRRCCPGCSARSRRCSPRPIASSARWKRSPTSSARTCRREEMFDAFADFYTRLAADFEGKQAETGALTAFLKPKQ